MRSPGVPVAIVVIGMIGFLGGRELRDYLRSDPPAASVPDRDHARASEPHPNAPQPAIVAATPGAPPAAPSIVPPAIERALQANVIEPLEVTNGRRKGLLAELAEKTPNLAPAKVEYMEKESDRLALDKRKLRAAFLQSQISEADYVAALKDDIRKAMAGYEQVLDATEYQALTNRTKGANVDPFAMESLANSTAPNKNAAEPPAPLPSEGK